MWQSRRRKCGSAGHGDPRGSHSCRPFPDSNASPNSYDRDRDADQSSASPRGWHLRGVGRDRSCRRSRHVFWWAGGPTREWPRGDARGPLKDEGTCGRAWATMPGLGGANVGPGGALGVDPGHSPPKLNTPPSARVSRMCSSNHLHQVTPLYKRIWIVSPNWPVTPLEISQTKKRRSTSSLTAWTMSCVVLVFLNDITRNIIPSNGAEILLVYYGYRVHPQAHGYTIVAFHPGVFQGYHIYLIPWEDHSRDNLTNNYMLLNPRVEWHSRWKLLILILII